ncbi:unnamed protein product [Pseudo-nitzschia multistriata]|uniref:ABC transporter domain-containing protein n=1 Tax=Pseudo-nitzschia multistriata TaxID=183589 RepID=A0A448YVG4_9STRA|nr:unnamed protein product [Pseudo-nitzschia multistriata]
MKKKNDENDNISYTDDDEKKFPADAYSFVALFSPWKDSDVFCIGMIVFLFQSTLFLLMILSVLCPGWRSTGVTDNPDSDFESHWWAGFSPANASPIVKATQIIALLSFVVFPEASLLDISSGVEIYPDLWRRNLDESTLLIAFSCTLRIIQGLLAILAVFLLVITSSNATEIILNFTAVNFISLLDDIAFDLAKDGKYGRKLKVAAKRVENEALPRYTVSRNSFLRHKVSVCLVSIILFGMLSYVILCQESSQTWITRIVQIRFGNKDFKALSGCYDIIDELTNDGRYNYEISDKLHQTTRMRFGYCKKSRRWVLFSGRHLNGTEFDDPCLADEYEIKARSSKTDSFDIMYSLDEPWYSPSGEALDFTLVDLEDNQQKCNSVVGDGLCNEFFNNEYHRYDDGDCCFMTCNSTNCGKNGYKFTPLFGVTIAAADGYPRCDLKAPDSAGLKYVFIRLDSISISDRESNPFLVLECDGKMVFSIPVDQEMQNKTEKAIVPKEGKCTLNFELKRSQEIREFSWDLNYSIYSAGKDYIYRQEMGEKIFKGHSSSEKSKEYFSSYDLGSEDHLSSNIGTLLHGNTSLDLYDMQLDGTLPTEIGLLTDLTSINLCGNSFKGGLPSEIGFLTKLTEFDIACKDIDGGNANITDGLRGTLPTEIGSLSDLTSIRFGIRSFTGTLPSEIGLTKLSELDFHKSSFTGSLPSEIGLLTNLAKLDFNQSSFTGDLPSEIGLLTQLSELRFYNTSFTGVLPTEIWSLTNVSKIWCGNSTFNGSLPSEIGFLTKLTSLVLFNSGFKGTLPSEIGLLTRLTFLRVDNNHFTGSLPTEIGWLAQLVDLKIDSNSLTGTFPTEFGYMMGLHSLQIQHNNLLGTIPREIAKMASLYSSDLRNNSFTGSLPSELSSSFWSFNLDGNNFSCPIPRGVVYTGACGAEEHDQTNEEELDWYTASASEGNRRGDSGNEVSGSTSAEPSLYFWNYNSYVPFFDPRDGAVEDGREDRSRWNDNGRDLEQASENAFQGERWNLRSNTAEPSIRQQFRTFWAMSKPYFSESGEGRCLFSGLVVLMLLDSAARIAFSYLARDFWSALGDKDADRFYAVMLEFLVALCLLAPINVFYRFQRQRLGIKWRQWMTERLLHLYFYNPHQIYYRLEQNQRGQNQGDSEGTSRRASNHHCVDNPDQRLAEDVRSFTQYSLSLFLTIAVSLIDLTAFSVVLYTIKPVLFLSIVGFATFGTAMTCLLGKDLVKLNFQRLSREADFRYSLVRLRENAESIAFFRGEATEGHELTRRFQNVVQNAYDLIGTQRNLEFFTTSYNYLTWILPVVVVAPEYMAGAVELGVVQQAAAAFGHVLDDLSLIINEFEGLSEFSASIGRLHQFVTAVKNADPDRRDETDESAPLMGYPPGNDGSNSTANNSGGDGIFKTTSTSDANAEAAGALFDTNYTVHRTTQESISLKEMPALSGSGVDPTSPALCIRNLNLYTPEAAIPSPSENFLSPTARTRELIRSLNLELKWGERLLIIGPSGIGKSSLLRAIAGLWTSGSGVIERANTSDVYFLPQKPYCPLGSLRDQLLYPIRSSTSSTVLSSSSENKSINDDNNEIPKTPCDQKLLEILESVDLSGLAKRSGNGDPFRGLDAVVDWSNILSLGEQQRLAFARVLFHEPRLVIVDEATSAMDISTEEKMYKLLIAKDLTYVSVGHRPTLLKYHTKRLELHKAEGTSDYTFEDIRSTADGVANEEVNLFFR